MSNAPYRQRRIAHAPCARGFTLLEALIAIVILALSLSVLMPSHTAGLRALAAVDEHLQARLLAQSVLAELPRDRTLRPGIIEGNFRQFAWTLSISPLEDRQSRSGTTGGWALYRLALVVSWRRNRRIELETLRMGWTQ